MPEWMMVVIVIWVIGALAGMGAGLEEHHGRPEYFGICAFWPLFFVLFILKGALKGLIKAFTSW